MPILLPLDSDYPETSVDASTPESGLFETASPEPIFVGLAVLAVVGIAAVRSRTSLSISDVKRSSQTLLDTMVDRALLPKAAMALTLLCLLFPPWVIEAPNGLRYYLGRAAVWHDFNYAPSIDVGRLALQLLVLWLLFGGAHVLRRRTLRRRAT